MSAEANPKGKPVRPPIPNMGRKDIAKSMGVLNRIDPPQREMKKHVRITMDGMEIISVVIWKKELIPVPIPVKNMWCAQTINDIKPRKMIE